MTSSSGWRSGPPISGVHAGTTGKLPQRVVGSGRRHGTAFTQAPSCGYTRNSSALPSPSRASSYYALFYFDELFAGGDN